MSTNDGGRKVDFRIDLFKRPEYRRVRKRHPMTLEWLMALVSVAREALDNGRICAGGTPLSRQDIEDETGINDEDWLLEGHQELGGLADPLTWIDDCLKHGLLQEDSDGAFRIPNWHTWYRTRFDDCGPGGLPEAFFDLWHQKTEGKFLPALDLCAIAREVGYECNPKQMAHLLTPQIEKKDGFYILSRGRSRSNLATYAISINDAGIVQESCRKSAGICR